jgi:uncharacterized protein with PQ loop repeat
MWQRIQTLYLFLAICLNLAVFSIDLAELKFNELFNNFSIYGLTDAASGVMLYSTLPLVVLCALSMVVSLIIIFMFKKRQLQIKLAQLNLFLQVGFVVAIFFMIEAAGASLPVEGTPEIVYGAGAFLSIIPLLFLFLAIKATKKDEALVRAADRIR